MKIIRVTCCLSVLLLSLVAVAFTVSVPRAHAASGQTIMKVRGQHVEAAFDSVDGCIETTVTILADTNKVHNPTESTAEVFIGQFDTCTQTTVLDAAGQTNTPVLQIDTDLLSASLSATIPLTDNQTGQPLFNVTVNMTWKSTSAIQHQIETINYHTQGFRLHLHVDRYSRDAIASGTVSDGKTNFTPPSASLLFVDIASGKLVQVTITHTK